MQETKKNSSHLVIDARHGFFHTMLSYRVQSDQDFVMKIHDKLHLLAPNAAKSVSQVNQLLDSPFPSGFDRDKSTHNSSLHVFLDKYCLKNGESWEGDGSAKSGGFVGAVRLSPVFVPLLSATEIVTQNTESESSRQGSGKGSIGQMINLAHKDTQDNVLLELIVARELHLMSKKTNSKTNGKKALAPCSHILPLFRQNIWTCNAVSSLPKTASKSTNDKAKKVMKQMGIPDEDISEELINDTLTVHAVCEFFTQFQGIKLYERGEEPFQVAAAASAIIGVIDGALNIVAESEFHNFKMNSSQLYELSGFMAQLNLSYYTPILAIHGISNVYQLAKLKHSRADSIVQSVAEYGARVLRKSTMPIELCKVGSAMHAAQSSPLGKALNDRFRDFIDRDASLVTMLSSSSLIDIFLSKKIAVLGLFCFASYNTAVWLAAPIKEYLQDPNEMSKSYTTRKIIYPNVFPFFLLMCACVVAVFHSPRFGRYVVASALLIWTFLMVLEFAVSAYSAVNDDDCVNCSTKIPSDALATLSDFQKCLTQPTLFLLYSGLFVCSLFAQKHFFLWLLIANFVDYFLKNTIIGWPFVIKYIPFRASSMIYWFGLFIFMLLLRYVGNKRARLIYKLNSEDVEKEFKKLYNNETAAKSLFSKLCASPFCEPQVQQPGAAAPLLPPCFGIFACKRQNCEQAQDYGTELSTKAINSPVVCEAESNQHALLNCGETQRESGTQPLAQNNSDNQPKTPGKSCNMIRIEDIFKSERTLTGEVLQRQRSFEKLVQDSEFINDAFQEWVSSWVSGGPVLEVIYKHFFPPSETFETNKIDKCFYNLSCNSKTENKSTESATPQSRSEGGSVQDDVKGIRIRGPLKHVDRAIAKAHRAYSGNFRRLTDIVRCCLVVDTTQDMIKLVQKILDNSKHCNATKPPLVETVSWFWRTAVVEKVLGLKPVPVVTKSNDRDESDNKESISVSETNNDSSKMNEEKPVLLAKKSNDRDESDNKESGSSPENNQNPDKSDEEDKGAFELLRVFIFRHITRASSFNCCQVRNRFASSDSVGGYRDINFKIRVGFKCDSTKGRPLFCSVKHWRQADVKTMQLYECMDNEHYHNNYILARNLMCQ